MSVPMIGSEETQMGGGKRPRDFSGIEQPNDPDYVPTVRWYPKGDPRNKQIMAKLKASRPKLYKQFVSEALTRRKFPWQEYGTRRTRRGTPESIQTFGPSWAEANALQRQHRNDMGFYGRGRYHMPSWSQFVSGVKDVGHLIGPRILGGLEDLALRKLAGMGAYESVPDVAMHPSSMTSNILSSTTSGNFGSMKHIDENANQLIGRARPSIGFDVSLDETNSITITHSEFIQDITPSVSAAALAANFQVIAFLSINPGLPATFPWLSNLAQFYEEYEFEQLVFTFKSMVTDGNANASGTVIMATQYNPANQAFTSKQVMENYDYANSVKVTSDAHHGLECDPKKHGGSQIEYIRTGAIPTNQDLKTYDLATFQLSTTGTPSSAITIGELWVHYKVKLRKSKIPQIGQITRVNALNLSIGLAPGKTASNILNGAVVNSTNISGYSIDDTSVTLPSYVTAGNYVVVFSSGGLTNTGNVTVSASVNGVAGGATISSLAVAQATTFATGTFSVVVNNTTIGGALKLTIGGMSGLTASTGGILNIYQIYSAT